MKMEHYLSQTDYLIWQVIHNGNGVYVTTDTNGMIKVLSLKTAEEVVARERERKARITLLMALPEDHFAKFYKIAAQKRSGKLSNQGLHKGYDRYQTLLHQLKIHGAGVSHDDANQKFLRSLPSSWSQVSLIRRTKPRTGRKLQFDTKDPVGFYKTKVECFNCTKMGHFARDYKDKGNQDNRRIDDGYNGNKT
nr:hypothetical protein [Tanacetum cinerariifolium]